MSLRRQVSPVMWELSLEEETLAGHMEATLERDRLNVWAAVGREDGAQPHPGRCQAQPLSWSSQSKVESIWRPSLFLAAGPKI